MKKTFALLLATLLVFAGCKATDPKDAFFSALERNSEVKNAHEVAAISLVMDNEGSPYTFMDIQLEGDVSLETYDMAVKYDFSLMDIGMKMELYKKGEDALVKMPIVAKYVQMPSELFNIYNPEEMKSLQDLVSQESKSLYEQMGESLQIDLHLLNHLAVAVHLFVVGGGGFLPHRGPILFGEILGKTVFLPGLLLGLEGLFNGFFP